MLDVVRGRRIAVGAGLSLGAALGMTATAQAADFTVDRVDDPGPSSPCLLAVPDDCSLRQAIGNTQNSNRPAVDRVLFQSGLSGTISLSGIEGLRTTEPLDIVGPGARVLSVTGGALTSAILTSEQGAAGDPVNVSGLTLIGGNAGGGNGGGIYSVSTNLTIDGLTISHNHAADNREGGGIEASGNKLIIKNSTISDNDGGNGGGLHALDVDVGIENSTISGNTATSTAGSGYGYGGGIWLDQGGGGSLVVYAGTITDNHAHYGGGISASSDTMVLGDTVVANNIATDEVDLRNAGADTFKLAHSLVEAPKVGSTEDITGFAGSNILGVDPQLGPLVDNGGSTQTEKPSLTSPLLDKGITVGGFADQRGLLRPFDISSIANTATGDAADIGAVELQASDFSTQAGGGSPPASQPPSQSQTVRKKCKKKPKKRAVTAKKCRRKHR
jgi:hypothetical protein